MRNAYLSQVDDTREIHAKLMAPAATSEADKHLIADLVARYPYFKAAHLLSVRAEQSQEMLTNAAIYANGVLVYKFSTLAEPVVEVAEEETFDEIGEFDLTSFTKSAEKADTEILPKEEPITTEFFVPDTASNDVPFVYEFPEIETVTPDEPEHADLSKYDDDQLPYTFLWWLAKTRAAHSQIFQPYATPTTATPVQDNKIVQEGLQHQYVEHIFHLQTGIAEHRTAETSENALPTKDQEIIDAFLESDPQIKPPPVNKLDNENKARKSAEDHNDVVSETLAAIYIEQMLYRKAIDTYEKLSLKFPEKSRYFADLIKSLEKKI